MTTLNDLFDAKALRHEIEDGYIREVYHPTEPLAILNYTDKAQYDRHWNEVTRVCRGLIYNTETHEVVARPFEKFFNWNEPEAAIGLDEPVVALEKMDGSLGILYPKPSGGYAIATRGSFTSEQALRGTLIWEAKYASRFVPEAGYTALFEIINPRIASLWTTAFFRIS